MRKPLDIINVVDVESTCWDIKPPPKGQVSEIIEIGICALDVKALYTHTHESLLIWPIDSKVSDFCTSLTTITPEMLAGKPRFEDACRNMMAKYKTQDRIWASYGDYDRTMFTRQCERLKLPYPFGSRHINVKTLIAVCMGWDSEVGMDQALERLGMPLLGTHHRAIDDAVNIASILAVILKRSRK